MEHESTKTQTRETAKRFPSKRFHFFMYFVLLGCILTCIVFQFVYNLSMKRKLDDVKSELTAISEGRLAVLESKVNAISKELKRSHWDRKPRSGEKGSLARHRRTINPQISLSDLNKRIITLESRTVKLSEDILKRTSLRGRDGRDGTPGPPGTAGRDGRDGRQGPPGPRGLAGPKGDIGPAGIPGPKGPSGPQGLKGPEGKGLSGVRYNRWGRTNCSGDASVVYTGVMGSGYYTHHGGGSNFLCLPHNPVFDKYISGWQGMAGIYGTEYQSGNFPGFTNNLDQHDAPCAVCYVRSRGSQLMIPATNKCPSGWTREYHGYLMTSHYGHNHASEYVCIDSNAEVVPGSHRDTNGALLYLVQSSCNHGLPCRPYIEGYELTCVVCTK